MLPQQQKMRIKGVISGCIIKHGSFSPFIFNRCGEFYYIFNSEGDIILGYITSFLAVGLTFGLFYFNAPYWCGKGMYKTSTNGIWRLYYLALSTMGHWLYILCENTSIFIQKSLFKRLKLKMNKRYPTLTLLINLFTYIGAIFLLTLGYEKICATYVTSSHSEDIDALVGGYGNVFEYIKVKVAFIKIIFDLSTENGGVGSFTSVILSVFTVIKMWGILILINTLYFSVIYGFLKEKLIEVNFLGKLSMRREENLNDSSSESESPTLKNLLSQIKKEIWDWAERQTVISNLSQNRKVLLAFIPFLFAFSSIMYVTGIYKANLLSTGFQILDSINVVNILLSFAITYMSTKVAQKGGAYIISISPERVQERFREISESARQQAQRFEEIRHRWADTNDLVRNERRSSNAAGGNAGDSGHTRGPGQRRHSNLPEQMDIFNNVTAAREYLEAEFQKKIRKFNAFEFVKAIEIIYDCIPPSNLSGSSVFSIDSKIVESANFYRTHPDVMIDVIKKNFGV